MPGQLFLMGRNIPNSLFYIQSIKYLCYKLLAVAGAIVYITLLLDILLEKHGIKPFCLYVKNGSPVTPCVISLRQKKTQAIYRGAHLLCPRKK